jgi:hypothetical protein
MFLFKSVDLQFSTKTYCLHVPRRARSGHMIA